MKYIFGLIIALFLLQSCQSSMNQTAETPDPVIVLDDPLPSLSKDQIISMYSLTDDVDIQFLEKSFSMNAPGAMAKNTIATYTDQAVDRVPCTEIAYLFVKSQGEQIAHIGVFLGEGCAYYIYYEDSRPKYANAMNQDGINFFTKILTQVKATAQ